jgi:hypothetical protein
MEAVVVDPEQNLLKLMQQKASSRKSKMSLAIAAV